LPTPRKIKAELARTEASRQEVINQANVQAQKLIEEARQAAARVQEVETQKAIAAAKDIVEKARQATETEHARMLTELRREVGRLVVQTTGRVVARR
jgi:F-type H+-transporting ATPase subunit b